ncbi:unnamed protein product [Rotaria socialis]|uniref:Peptidase S1 domain-containing protein n=1 Tax=Rotaria socialis TaxID=392032 RepID=A0A818QZW1_9BILA|nr:unnamed protein product [Rotaria socialis]
MSIVKNLVFFLILFLKQSISDDDFDRLPKPPVNYRHFVEQAGKTYKILGSCSEVKLTEPMSRCVIQIGHKYMLKYMSINFAQESTGSGVIICKSIENYISSIIILTAFHVVVPQMDLSFFTFMVITFLTTLIILRVPGGRNDFNMGSYSMDCQLISSRLILSKDWWDDIVALNNSQSISSGSSINVIGFVGRPPVSFDLIIDPFFSTSSPLIIIPAIHGETPEHFLLNNKFMNCTAQLRLIDNRKLFIDTPSTYGFSGGPCFLSSNRNQWGFIGILTGASKLWNTCTSLQHSTIFNYYYNEILLNKVEENVYKNDL